MLSRSHPSLKRVAQRVSIRSPDPEFTALFLRRQIGSKEFCARRHSSTAQPNRDSFLKSQPWSFDRESSIQNTQKRGDLASFNIKLAKYATQGSYLQVLETAKSMKDAGVTPDVNTYTYIIQALARGGLSTEVHALIEDMTRMGLHPTRAIMTHLIEAQADQNYSHVAKTLQLMRKLDLSPGPETYAVVIERYVDNENLEMALQILEHMEQQNITPELQTIQAVISLAAEVGLPRLAIDVANTFEKRSVRRLDHDTWMKCLISSAEELYADGVCQCWTTTVQEMKLTPDEGLCQAVLHTAARHGLPDLTTDALRVLRLIGVEWQEHHFAPVIESFSRADRIDEAFSTLTIMRKSKVEPTVRSALSIVNAIGEDVDKLDNAWAAIDNVYQAGGSVELCALNVVLKVCVNLGDLQRAIGTYKAFNEYKVNPCLETFNLILECCVHAGHRELGDKILTDLREARISPDLKTYECMTLLCLTQDTYEDAFYYLEETKSSRLKPTYQTYDSLIRKCVAHNDPRYQIALEEMQNMGYQPADELLNLIEDAKEARRSRQLSEDMARLGEPGLDGAARKFIESGGLEGGDR